MLMRHMGVVGEGKGLNGVSGSACRISRYIENPDIRA